MKTIVNTFCLIDCHNGSLDESIIHQISFSKKELEREAKRLNEEFKDFLSKSKNSPDVIERLSKRYAVWTLEETIDHIVTQIHFNTYGGE